MISAELAGAVLASQSGAEERSRSGGAPDPVGRFSIGRSFRRSEVSRADKTQEQAAARLQLRSVREVFVGSEQMIVSISSLVPQVAPRLGSLRELEYLLGTFEHVGADESPA